jgi:tetratricopeptide (TPR) repeat protein
MLKTSILILLLFFAITPAQGQSLSKAEDYFKRSKAQLERGNIEQAFSDINSAINLNQNFAAAFLLRAIILEKKGQLDGVLADYSKFIELEPDAPGVEVIYNNRSMLRLSKGDMDGALEDINKAILLKPRFAEAYNGRAIIRLQKEDFEGALSDFDKSIELKPTLPSAFMGRGSCLYRKGNLQRALGDFNKAIELKKDYADAYVNRGVVRGLTGDLDGALLDLRNGVALDPRSVSDESRGHFISPFKNLNQFIFGHPANARAYQILGVFRLLQGKENEAEQSFNRSIKINSQLKPEINRIIKEIKQPK